MRVSDTSKGCNKKAWWRCSKNPTHIWEAIVANRCRLGQGCPYCLYKTEARLYEYVLVRFPDAIRGYRPTWSVNPVTGRILPFDIYIPSISSIVELDGAQHFAQISNWSEPTYTQHKDMLKTLLAEANGVRVIRLIQEDVADATDAWLDEHLQPHLVAGGGPPTFIAADESCYNIHIALYEEYTLESISALLMEKADGMESEEDEEAVGAEE